MEVYYQAQQTKGKIIWAASEYFGELAGKTFSLGNLEAKDIVKMNELSEIARLLLSAVAGAVIQHLLDMELPAQQIFQHGIITFQENANE